MFCFSLRKSFALAGALLAVACAAPTASAGAARAVSLTPFVPPSAAAGRSTAPSAETTDADRAAGIEWRFHAGSALYGAPAVAADGTAYIGTADGYVQAVNPDGSLKWSYTVEGAVAWSPIIDVGDHIVVATSAQRLYSISASGLPAWEVKPPAHVATDLAPTPRGGFLFGGTDGSLWAYSAHSTALWHAELGGTITSAPAIRGDHAIVGTSVGSGTVLWFLDGAAKRFQVRLGARIRGAPILLGDGTVIVVVGTALIRLDPRGNIVFRREGVDSFGVAAVGLVAVETNGDLIALGSDGSLTARVPLPAKASAGPVEIAPGVVCVGTEIGELLFVGPHSTVRLVAVAHAALHRPVLDAARRRVLVAAGDGTMVAVAVDGRAE